MPHRGPLSFIESDVADRPEDVGSMRGMFVESKRNEEAAAGIWSDLPGSSERPSPQGIPPSDATTLTRCGKGCQQDY
jgi:hypothetical protein